MFTDWKNQYSENPYTTQSNLYPALSDKLNGRLDFLGQHKRKPEFPVVTREKPRVSLVIAI